MAALYNDGGVPLGSFLVNGMIAESVSLTFPSKIIERPNEIGEPNGWVAIAGFPHGTCTLQIASIDDVPALGTVLDGLPGGTWVIVDMTRPFAIHDYYKCNVTLRKTSA